MDGQLIEKAYKWKEDGYVLPKLVKRYENNHGYVKFDAETNKLSFDIEIVPVYIIGNFAVKSRNAFTELDNKILRFISIN